MGNPYYSEFSAFVGSFLYALVLAALWLGICRVLPPLRKRLHVSYGIAMAISVMSLIGILVKGYAVNYLNLLGALFCTCLIFWKYRHALAKLDRSRQTSN